MNAIFNQYLTVPSIEYVRPYFINFTNLNNFNNLNNLNNIIFPVNIVTNFITNFVTNFVTNLINMNTINKLKDIIAQSSQEFNKIYKTTTIDYQNYLEFKMEYIFLILALLGFTIYLINELINISTKLNKEIIYKFQEMEEQINYLKKNDIMRENTIELLMISNKKLLQPEVNKKFKEIDNQLKKMNKQIKLYE